MVMTIINLIKISILVCNVFEKWVSKLYKSLVKVIQVILITLS